MGWENILLPIPSLFILAYFSPTLILSPYLPLYQSLSHLISFSLPLTQLFEDLDKRIWGEVVKKWERGRVLHYLLFSPLSHALFLSQRQQQTKTLYQYNSKRVNIKVQNKLSSSEYVQCFVLTMDYFLTPLWII